MRSLYSELFWREVISKPLLFTKRRNLKRLLATVDRAYRIGQWAKNFIYKHELSSSSFLFYTYWFWESTLGIAILKRQYPNIKLVSRAHGFDLYETRHSPPHIIGRPQCLGQLNRLYTISEHGQKYIQDRYTQFSGRCQIARLGTKEPGFITQRSADGTSRIVSCSFISPVKRLDLLLDGIKCLGEMLPSNSFHYFHIGDGTELDRLNEMTTVFPSNIKSRFCGKLTNEEVYTFYKEHTMDVFVNVSQMEGMPVSIMEPQSCGIPVVATAVGGIPEMVSEENGCLLTSNPTPDEIAMKIRGTLLSERHELKRKASREKWSQYNKADVYFPDFAKQLYSLL